MIGPETEKLYGGRNYMELLSVFDSPLLFRVEWGNRELGWVHELSLQSRRDGSDPVILLGGRPWRVRSVIWQDRVAYAEPCDLPGRSRWLGSSAPLSFALSQAMRAVLQSALVSQNWSKRAQAELASFGNLAPTDSNGTVLVETRSGCEWWTFAGLRANATLAEWLRSANLACRFDNLTLWCDASPYTLSTTLAQVEPSDPLPPEQFSGLKFSDALPNDVVAETARRRLYDVPNAIRILQGSSVQVQR